MVTTRLKCGGGGIRTHETLLGPTVFKTVALDHSATPPGGPWIIAEGEGFEPSRRRQPPTAFRVPRTRPDYATPPVGAPHRLPGNTYRANVQRAPRRQRLRRERDLNPRGSVNPQRHFQCLPLDQTMQSLLERPPDQTG